MKKWLIRVLALAAASVASVASAEFHTYVIEQLFSDSTGNVQFIVMHENQGMSAEFFWQGHQLTSTHAGQTKAFMFPNNLPMGMSCNPYYGCAAAPTIDGEHSCADCDARVCRQPSPRLTT
jgi:hypothetical protein